MSSNKSMSRTPVRINIYDMYWVNDYLSNMGIGVYHSGIEVYGIEYAYGGHPFAFTGIFENAPRDVEDLGENFRFRESVELGETDFLTNDVRHLVDMLGHDFRGDRYHLISKNCNHFTAALAKVLCGAEIPQWVNRLASISGSIPLLERFLPQEWLTPVALQHSIDEQQRQQRSASAQTSGGGGRSPSARPLSLATPPPTPPPSTPSTSADSSPPPPVERVASAGSLQRFLSFIRQ